MTEIAEFGATLDALLVPQPWSIDAIRLEDRVLEISGWALPPVGGVDRCSFTIDGAPFEQIEYPLPRDDLAEIFWYRQGARDAAFRCRTAFEPGAFSAGYATLRYADRETGAAFREDQNYYFPDEADPPPLPGPARRKRVAGSEEAGTFVLVGYSTYRKIDSLLRSRSGQGLGEIGAVLDWGCGCGRLARYILSPGDGSPGGGRLTGVDIDADNIGWCQESLAGGSFHTVPLHPPTDLPRDAFDLILGISVFTHLREREQIEWLYELSRLVKPGGLVLVTVLGETAVCRARCRPGDIEHLFGEGYVVVEDNTDLKGVIEDESYYVNTYISPDYLRRSWSRFFDVQEIIPATIGNLQDLVILRAPS